MQLLKALILFLMSANVFGQKIERDLYLKHSIKQDGLAYSFTVLDKDSKLPKFEKQKDYFWFKAQKVLATQGGGAGDLLHGPCEIFYDSKQLAQKGFFYKGLKDNEWVYWRKDGSLLKAESWHKGKQRGDQFFYDEKGEIRETVCYARNYIKQKKADSLIVTNLKNGKVSVTTFDSIGQVTNKSHFLNHLKEGKSKEYQNGKLIKTESYYQGKLVVAEKSESKKYKLWFSKNEKKTKSEPKEAPKKNTSTTKNKTEKQAISKKSNEVNRKKGKKLFEFFKKKKTKP